MKYDISHGKYVLGVLLIYINSLTFWGPVAHICVSKLTTIASDNGLSPGRRQAIIWNNDGILLIWPLGTNFSEISIEIHSFSFKKMHLKMSSGKWRPFCLGLNVLSTYISARSSSLLWWCQASRRRDIEQRLTYISNINVRYFGRTDIKIAALS